MSNTKFIILWHSGEEKCLKKVVKNIFHKRIFKKCLKPLSFIMVLHNTNAIKFSILHFSISFMVSERPTNYEKSYFLQSCFNC